MQEFDITRLLLTEIEGNTVSREQWENEMQFFYPLDDQSDEAKLNPPSVTTMLKLYKDGGHEIDVARRDVISLLMPTDGLLAHLWKRCNLREFTQPNIYKLQEYLARLRAMYLDLFNNTQRWDIT